MIDNPVYLSCNIHTEPNWTEIGWGLGKSYLSTYNAICTSLIPVPTRANRRIDFCVIQRKNNQNWQTHLQDYFLVDIQHNIKNDTGLTIQLFFVGSLHNKNNAHENILERRWHEILTEDWIGAPIQYRKPHCGDKTILRPRNFLSM